jgi:predicted transcriptional regulator
MAKREKTDSRPPLSPLELAVMNAVWELGECSTRQAIDAYNARAARRLAPTTIRTVLSSLRRKGYMEPVATVEPGLRLRPAVAREPVRRGLLRQLVAQLFDGSPGEAIAHLIRNEKIDAQEIDELRRMLDEARKRRGRR